MIIQKLTKLKESSYEVQIEEKTYQFDEETILKYRLFQGNDVSKETLEECIEYDSYEIIKRKAYSYHLKYLKNQYETIHYLTERDISYSIARQAVSELKEKKLLDEQGLCIAVASSLSRNSNGPYLIKQKLKNRHFEEAEIQIALESITEEDYEYGKEKLLKKAKKKYESLPELKKKQKLKEIFYRHGYIEV